MPRPIHSGVFQDFMRSIYSTAQGILTAAPIATQGIPRNQFTWGAFQQRVVPHRGLWPIVFTPGGTINTFDNYRYHADQLRASLTRVKNVDALSPDEPNHVPPTRLDLLDEAFRKAFYSNPPIPFVTDVVDASSSQHEVWIDWDLDTSGTPVQLRVKIACPVQPFGAGPTTSP